eukprot:SAG31_NODE_3589_length_4093_cov_2.991487_5_plen_202_part_00
MTESQIVNLNVGGTIYSTSLETLRNHCQGSFLHSLFSGSWHVQRDECDRVFIDRDGPRFRAVLNFLRSGFIHVKSEIECSELLEEADFYGLEHMRDALLAQMQEFQRQKKQDKFERRQEQQQRLHEEAKILHSKPTLSASNVSTSASNEVANSRAMRQLRTPIPTMGANRILEAGGDRDHDVPLSPGPCMSPSHFQPDAEF